MCRCPHSLALELLTEYVPPLNAALASLPPVTDAAQIPCGMDEEVVQLHDNALCVCFDRSRQEDTVVFVCGGNGRVLECTVCK